jgi:hypothetical protein
VRHNRLKLFINLFFTFNYCRYYSQCSEICGILHSSMPIVVESVSLVKFLSWLQEQSPWLLIFRVGLPKSTGKIQLIYYSIKKNIHVFINSSTYKFWKEIIIICLLMVLCVLIGTILIQDVSAPILCHGPNPDPSTIEAIKECSHNYWDPVKPKEFIRLCAPVCDNLLRGHTYMGETVYHEAFSNKLELYHKCKACPANLCQDCYKLYQDMKTS